MKDMLSYKIDTKQQQQQQPKSYKLFLELCI